MFFEYVKDLGAEGPKSKKMFPHISIAPWVIEMSTLRGNNVHRSAIIVCINFSEIVKNLGAGGPKPKRKVCRHFSRRMGHINF